jgi:ribosomal protein S18 acetylase RimI-like enzyme
MITVRRSTPDDSLNVATVHVRSWQRAFAGVFPQALLDGLDPQTRAASYGRGGNTTNITFVAESDNAIIGFVSAGPERETEDETDRAGEVYAIYVDPARWSGGAGRALMDAAVAELRNRGYERIVLWTSRDTPQSHHFYERYGFQRDGGARDTTVGNGTPHQATVPIVRFTLQLAPVLPI